ncbi:DUF1127 domain-containing protein [Rhodobacteraceae bacterium M382]|nr:DUF1127 domain-containing protein [Rhodobacteraceae bacterium M382]
MTYIADHSHCTPRNRSWSVTLITALAVARQRRALKKLDAAALDDIGITKAQAEAESSRLAWDAPDHWCR